MCNYRIVINRSANPDDCASTASHTPTHTRTALPPPPRLQHHDAGPPGFQRAALVNRMGCSKGAEHVSPTSSSNTTVTSQPPPYHLIPHKYKTGSSTAASPAPKSCASTPARARGATRTTWQLCRYVREEGSFKPTIYTFSQFHTPHNTYMHSHTHDRTGHCRSLPRPFAHPARAPPRPEGIAVGEVYMYIYMYKTPAHPYMYARMCIRTSSHCLIYKRSVEVLQRLIETAFLALLPQHRLHMQVLSL